ncbi:hypothetical protein GGC65_002274 [Sphingopyxis sp. OAS728]|nr:hypothetical protein [Sphingopyxis sp. OAS728]
MLDDIAVGPLAEDPARKDAAPFVVALILHRQLDKRTRFGRIFPRRGLLARAQPHDRAADPRDIAGLHLEIADQPVALVEQADDGDTVGHRGRALDAADFLRHTFGFGDGRDGGAASRFRGCPVAGGQRGRSQKRDQRGRNLARHAGLHSAPGRQAS